MGESWDKLEPIRPRLTARLPFLPDRLGQRISAPKRIEMEPHAFDSLSELAVAPYEGLLRLLFEDVSPAEAADSLRPLIGWMWEEPLPLPDSAPRCLQQFRDMQAMRRFGADNPVSLQLVCVHLLYRAAASLGPEDCEASLLLIGLARDGLRDVLLIWLGGSDCPHCTDLRHGLETMSGGKRDDRA